MQTDEQQGDQHNEQAKHSDQDPEREKQGSEQAFPAVRERSHPSAKAIPQALRLAEAR